MFSVNLDDLIKDYEHDLTSKLRGFGKENQYTEHWVPGTTKIDSFNNLINSFVEVNQLDFSISFNLNNTELSSHIMSYQGKIGKLEKTLNEKNIIIKFKINKDNFHKNFKKKITAKNVIQNKNLNNVKKVKKPDVTKLLNDDFRDSVIKMRRQSLKNNKKIIPENCNHFSFLMMDSEVHIYIDKSDFKIKSAFHELEEIKAENIIIDLFIDNILGKSIQEAAEHSVIYLEHYLRPKIIEEKIKGIILPHNGGRIFQDLNTMIRTTFSKCKSELGFENKINKEFTKMSPKWIALDENNKEKLINEVIRNYVLKELNIGEDEILLNRIEMDFRIIVELSYNFRKRQENENILLKVEKIIQNKIDQRLELFTMEIKDQNKLRFKNSPQKNL